MSTFKISNFLGGLNQSADDSVLSVNQSRDAQNVDVSAGTLKTINGYSKYVDTAAPAGITRLMKFYKTNTTTGATTSYLLAATVTAIYYWTGSAWSALGTGFTSGDWDFINYQIQTTDYIFMGNGEAMKKWDGTTFSTWSGNPPLAKSITLSNERVWITGVKAYPNSVFYSDDPYDEDGDGITGDGPENWTGGEDESGEVYVPTQDGGVCIGVSTIFSDLVIFKTNTIHRVIGTYPAVYEVKTVYSSVGAIAEKTIVQTNDRAFFLSKDGLYYYNGVSAYPLLGDMAKDIVINPSYAQNAVSIVYKNKLYCAFPEGDSTVNNAVFVYDLLNKTLMIWRGISVTDFMEYSDELLFTNAAGYVYHMDADATDFDGTAISAYWETPWQDGYSSGTAMYHAFHVTKTADTLYFYAKGNGMLRIDITFDNKTKTKNVTLSPSGKLHSLSLNLEGRRFKMKFSNVSGSRFELIQPELTYEADED